MPSARQLTVVPHAGVDKDLVSPCGCAARRQHSLSRKTSFSRSCPVMLVEGEAADNHNRHAQGHRNEDSTTLRRNNPKADMSCTSGKLALISCAHSFRSSREIVEWIRQRCEPDKQVQDILLADGYNTPCRHHDPHQRCSQITAEIVNHKLLFGFSHGKAMLKSLDFDAFDYSQTTLVDLCVEIFVENVRSQMVDNPYHNWFHVVDVTQTLYSLGLQSGAMHTMSAREVFSSLAAALCHDLEHPGVNNSFLIKTRSALASQYSMHVGCLEKHHSFRASELMTNDEGSGLLDSLAAEAKSEIIGRVQSLILATDMSRHGEYMTLLSSLVASRDVHDLGANESLRQQIAELLIKCADMSNVLKPFPVARRWAIRITDEFFKQGDLERSLGMDITTLCDRHKESRVGLQKGFIGFISPFYAAMSELLPLLRPLVERIGRTRDMWDNYSSDDALLAGDE